ncbi:MAG: AAA family ATPase [Candidatus Didemnitutus sp.]|nr:AAA family ATPase [Candidatus Didemnitutus sp.]
MLRSLHIENFKRFRSLDVPQFKRVNLISGRNNTGKTALLEAIMLLLDHSGKFGNLPAIFRNAANLGDQDQNFWKWLLPNGDESARALLLGKTERHSSPFAVQMFNFNSTGRNWPRIPGFSNAQQIGSIGSMVAHQVNEAGHMVVNPLSGYRVSALSTRPSDPQQDAANYDRVVLKKGAEARLEKLLRKLEPRLLSVRSIKPHGASLIYVDLGLDEKIPAVHLGQGFNRLLAIYSEILASGSNVLLIDEIENGIHHEILPDVWKGIRELAESENIQVFATTHSWECVVAAHETYAETLDYDFALHRMVEVEGEVSVQTLGKEALEASIKGLIDVR